MGQKMSNVVGIAGYATFNGLTFINSSNNKVVRAIRNKEGNIIIKELVFFCKIMKLYDSKIGRIILKIPIISDILKIFLLLGFSAVSFLSETLKRSFIKKEWTVKKIAILLLLFLSVYFYFSFDSIFVFLPLIPFIFLLKSQVMTTLEYHGAEHKVINMFENTMDINSVTIQTVKEYSKIHDRCGTNLIFLILPMGLIFYLFISIFSCYFFNGDTMEYLGDIFILIIGMKLLKLFQKPLFKKFLKPGRFMQKYITTKEPDEKQIEVALFALKSVLS